MTHRRARISSQWPSRMKTSRTDTASKNCPPSLKKNVDATLKRYPVPTLSTISAAMPSVPFFSARQADTKKGQLGYTMAALANKNSHSFKSNPNGGAGACHMPPIGA